MSTTTDRSSMARKAMLSAAVIAPALFIPLDVIDGLFRPSYSITRHWVSHLSLGEWGWLGTSLLAVTAGLLAVGAVGLLVTLRGRNGRVATAVAQLVAAAGLVAAAAFRMDPSLGFPAGADETVQTATGTVHQIAGPVFILGLGVALFTAPRSLRSIGEEVRPAAFRIAGVALLFFFVLCTVLVTLDYATLWPEAPSGLAERIAIAIGLVGVAVVAHRARRSDGRARP